MTVSPRESNRQQAQHPARTVALATLCVFAFVEHGRPYLLYALGVERAAYRDLADLTFRHYTWYWVPALLLAVLLFGRRRALGALGLTGNPAVAVAVGLVGTLPMFVGYALHGQLSTSATLLRDVTRTALLPGVMEEILFRGLLFGFLFRFASWGFVPAALIGAILFGVGHLWQGSTAAECAGVFAITGFGAMWFSWLYIEWGMNLWVPIAFHMLMNLAWDLFGMGESALGDGAANALRFATVGLSIVLTVVVARRRGGRVIRGRRWWRGSLISGRR